MISHHDEGLAVANAITEIRKHVTDDYRFYCTKLCCIFSRIFGALLLKNESALRRVNKISAYSHEVCRSWRSTVCFSLWAKNVRSGRSALRQPCSVKGHCVKDALVLARERGDATLSGSTLEFVYIKTLLSISHDSFPSGALVRMNSLAHCASR